MKYRVSRLVTAALLMTLMIVISAVAVQSAVVVYLDESGSCFGYEHPEAFNPESALNLLAFPPSSALTDGNALSSAILPMTRVLSIKTKGDTTTVDFSVDIIGQGLDESRLASIFDQVKATLYQFGMTGNLKLTAGGKALSDYLPQLAKVQPSPEALQHMAVNAGPGAPIVGTGLASRIITVSPGHGKRWNGSGWNTARPVYCSPLNQEDYHNDENAAFLKVYLEQDNANVKMMRCVDKTFGNSPWASNTPWWQMGACYWLQHLGYPESVCGTNLGAGGSDDTYEINGRPLSSDYDGSDIYLSLHTNGLVGDCAGTSCPTGTASYYDNSSTHAAYGAVSQALATAVNNGIIDAIRTKYPGASGWSNRGVFDSGGAYGEIRVPSRAATLVELAFHDSCDTDALKLGDNFFKSTSMWGVYKGICDYFGTTPTWDFYSCELVSHDIPAAMGVGEIRTVHVTLRNRGVLWNDAKAFHLGSIDDSDPFTTTTRQAVSGEVGPNATYTYTFNLKAPNAVGTFTTDWRMIRDGYQWFGPTVSQDIVVTGDPDYEAPSVPTNLSGSSTYSYRINLTWDASTDNVGVTSYNIYRDNVKIGSSATMSYTDNTCSPSTAYTYEVTACDGVPNESGRSLPAIITSQDPDSSAPTVPGNLHSTTVTSSSVGLAWNASTDNYAVVGYNVYRNAVKIGSSATTSYTDITCASSTTYTYTVTAYDAIPNESGASASAVVTTQSPYVTVWAEGFDGAGSFSNWTVVNGYAYDTAQSKGIITGIGSAFASGTAVSQMWRSAAARPFADCRVSAYYYDTKGGYKSGTCGVSQRESLRLTAIDGAATMFLEHGIYSAPSYATYNYRTVGGSGITWSAVGNRWSATTCTAKWNYYETTVTPGNPGASPVGIVKFLVTDSGGTVSTTPILTTDFFSFGVGRVYLGMNLTSGTADRRWDDIKVEARVPGAPTIGAATANFASQITWTWTRADNNLFGFNVADDSGTIKSPQYPASGWKTRATTSWAETGLAANTLYSRKVLAWNGSLDSAYSGTVSKYTLSALPTAVNVVGSRAVNSWSSNPDIEFTAVGGFGPGKAEYYRAEWDQSPTHAWTGTESIWAEATTSRNCSLPGAWYLHVKGYNEEDVANGTLDLGPFNYDTTGPSAATVTDEGAYTPSTSELKATISATDTETGIAAYQYAIGTTSGGTEILDWTTSATADVTATGLTLSAGTTYYFSGKAQNGTGIWGDPGNSDGIEVVADTGTIPDAKKKDDTGNKVALLNKAVTANFSDHLYIQEPGDGFSGIRVDKGGFAQGSFVSVAGLINSLNGERIIQSATVKAGTAGVMPHALMLLNKFIGGESLNDYTPGIVGAFGTNNIGLLVTVTGKLTKTESGYWFVNDGSGMLYDAVIIGIPVDASLLSTAKKAELATADNVVVTGICQPGTVNSLIAPVVKLRGDGDIVYYH